MRLAGRPCKVLLATFGTLGDVYPFVALAAAIRARHIEPVVAAPLPFREFVEREGLTYAPLRPQVQDVCDALGVDTAGAYRIMRRNPHFILDEIYLRFLRETYEDVLSAAADASVILVHSLLIGASLAAEKSRLPSARIALAPMHLQSATSPSLTPTAPYVLRPGVLAACPYNKLVRSIVRVSVSMRAGRLRAFRATIGLPRTREDFFLDFGRPNRVRKVFGLYSPRFAPPQPDQPANLEVPGFPFMTTAGIADRTLEPGLEAFLEAGPAPIAFTLGSFAPGVSGAFYDVSVAAAQAIGRRCVLLAGARDAARLVDLMGPDVFVCAFAPHALLFPRCLCVVHHGGIGTTAEASRAGRPQVVVPFFGDQPDNAARVERIGLGVSIRLARYDVRRATAAIVVAIRADVVSRAEAFASSIAGEAGVAAVATWVESALHETCAAA